MKTRTYHVLYRSFAGMETSRCPKCGGVGGEIKYSDGWRLLFINCKWCGHCRAEWPQDKSVSASEKERIPEEMRIRE